MGIATRIQDVRSQIERACALADRDPAEVELLPVSKRHPADSILRAKDAGASVFGENRVQELVSKARDLAGSGIAWHMIGSLQTNKVQQVVEVDGLALVQTMDRIKLADALQLAAFRQGMRVDVLLQVNATGEEQKHGATLAAAPALLAHLVSDCPSLRPTGLMAMGPLHGDPSAVFAQVAGLREDLRQSAGLPLPILSMGMTDDMAPAIAAGSTMVRVGTGVFGPRLS